MAAEDSVLAALAGKLRAYDLGRPMFTGMPQSPNHPQFRMTLARRHGDHVRPDGASAANELIVTGGHVGTHIDALAHVSQDGLLHGGIDAAVTQTGGRFSEMGIDALAPIVARAILIDVPGALGRETCEPGYQISVDDLSGALDRQGCEIAEGDVVLIRTGWGLLWDDPVAYVGHTSGVPGIGESAARWLAGHRVQAVGGDSIAFEHLAPEAGHSLLPVHRIMLVEEGIHIIETLALEELARDGVQESMFVLSPLNIVGATGSPVRPLALVSE